MSTQPSDLSPMSDSVTVIETKGPPPMIDKTEAAAFLERLNSRITAQADRVAAAQAAVAAADAAQASAKAELEAALAAQTNLTNLIAEHTKLLEG